MHDATSALAGVASDMGPGHAKVISQKFYEQCARFDLARYRLAIYFKGNLTLAGRIRHLRSGLDLVGERLGAP